MKTKLFLFLLFLLLLASCSVSKYSMTDGCNAYFQKWDKNCTEMPFSGLQINDLPGKVVLSQNGNRMAVIKPFGQDCIKDKYLITNAKLERDTTNYSVLLFYTGNLRKLGKRGMYGKIVIGLLDFPPYMENTMIVVGIFNMSGNLVEEYVNEKFNLEPLEK